MTQVEWKEVQAKLSAPFKPEQVSWRVQGKANQNGQAQALAYIDARDVQDRLDEAVGAENWSFNWEPVAVVNGELKVAKGTLTIYGVSKSDVGDASNFEGTKGTISDALKRAAVMWGVGRYLYAVESPWVKVQGSRIAESEWPRLRALVGGKPAPVPATLPAPKAVPSIALECMELAHALKLDKQRYETMVRSYTANGCISWQSVKSALSTIQAEKSLPEAG